MAKEFYTKYFVQENTYETPKRLSFKDITGNTYEKVKVISWAGNTIYSNWKNKRNVWWCKCDCGETDYFLVDRSSLEKGLTTSCGCNYKNNKGIHSPYSIEEVSKNIDSRYTILEYNGKRKPCRVQCKICNDVVEEKSFYSIQQQKLVCSCKECGATEVVIDNIEKKYNYKVLSKELDTNTKGYLYSIKCNSCGVELEKRATDIKSKCPCHETSSGKSAVGVSAVYLLRDEKDKSLYKIGKSVDPYARCEDINTSVKKEGYDHKFSIIGVKWFASEQVSYYVENLYHQYFKDKAYYGFKGESNRDKTEFSGACETFTLDREDFVQFNKIYKSHIEFIQTEDVPFIVNNPFKEGYNLIRPVNNSGVNMWFRSLGEYYKYLGITGANNNVLSKSRELCIKDFNQWYSEYKISLKVLIDEEYYDSWKDFYDQHLHLAAIDFNNFKEKGKDVWEALTTSRVRKDQRVFYDADGTEATCTELYRKYNPLINYTSFKDYLLKGYCPKELSEVVPKNNITKVYMVGGKYYPNTELYKLTKPLVRKPTYYERIKEGWCPLVAACIPTMGGSLPNNPDYENYITDVEKYQNLKIKMGVK